MKQSVKALLWAPLITLLIGCGGGGGTSAPDTAADTADSTTTAGDSTTSDGNTTDTGNTTTTGSMVTITPELAVCNIGSAALTGGIYTDSDGTAPLIDAISKGAPEQSPGYLDYTQDDYRQILTGEQMGYLYGNLHVMAVTNYVPDFNDPNKGWPEIAHVMLRYVQSNARLSLLVSQDGVSGEGMNYHFLWLSGLEMIAAQLDGYQDPDDWTPPAGVKKITAPLTHDQIIPPSLRTRGMVTNAVKLTLPDGTDSGSHDTGLQYHDPSDPTLTSAWGAGGYHFGYSIEKMARPYLLSGYGQLGLGDGTLDERNLQTQSLIHFSPKTGANGHAHNDTLMFGLFGNGRNLLSFPGHQNQSHGPQNKNLVMVDEEWQNKYVSDIGGRVEVFAPMPRVQFARVDGSHIMQGGNANGTGGIWMDRYRRTLIQNTIDPAKAYTVDIFESNGGSQHDYLMRGSGVLVQNYPTTNLTTLSATMPIADSKEAVFTETQKASYGANDAFWVDITFGDDPNRGTRSHFPAQGEAGELYLNRMTEQWTDPGHEVPQYTIHRTGTAPLKSTFVAVHEVLDGTGSSFIQSVSRENIGTNAIGISVTLKNGRVDRYLVSFDGRKTMSYNGITADALMVAHSTSGAQSDMWMVQGTSMNDAARTLVASDAQLTGNIQSVWRTEDGAAANAFDTDMALDEGYELTGKTLLLEHYDGNGKLVFVNSYTIHGVVKTACGKTRIFVNTDPGVWIDSNGTQEIHYPRRTAATAKLRLVNSATTVPYIARVLPGNDRSERINAKAAHALDENGSIDIVSLPSDTSVDYVLNGTGTHSVTTNGKITLEDHAQVDFSADNPDGFVEADAMRERYYKPLPAIAGTGGDQGLIARYYSGITYNFDLDDPVGNSYDFAPIPSAVVHGLSFAQLSPLPTTGTGVGVIVSGYIDVPTTGLYRFYTRMDRMVQLKVDGKVLIEERGMRRAPQWEGEVYLEKGLHKIEVHQYANKLAHFSVLWEGPGIPYGEIPASILFQNIK